MTKEALREKAAGLPLAPGVYLMQDTAGTIIYVGKAKKLRNRVSQYFQESAGHTLKTKLMVEQVDTFDTILVSTELEALLLENALIKRYQPKYNILLKDDKGYPFLRLTTKSSYPRFSLVNQPANDGARYFGPYGSRHDTFMALEALCTAFKLPTCRRQFPRDIGKERPCLHYSMGRCEGFCRKEATQKEYRERIEQAVLVLEGKHQQLQKQLQQEMEQEAAALHFERCAVLRDRIRALTILSQKQKVIAGLCADTDVWAILREGEHCSWAVLSVQEGQLFHRQTGGVTLPVEEELRETLEAILSRFYLERESLPREILLPFAITGELEEALSRQAGRRVYVRVPQRGEKAALQGLAEENAKETMQRLYGSKKREDAACVALGECLGLAETPHRLEAWDISNLGSSEIVAGMTVFEDGRAKKRDWRRMQVKSVVGQADDYASMEEVLTRRFQRYLSGDSGFATLPDVLLIDGGASHTAVAERVLQRLGLSLPVYGMVKDDRHRTRALQTAEGREISLKQRPLVFALIGRIQEATHHYAVEYQQELHQKRMLHSELQEIAGMGEKRTVALLKRFGSMAVIRQCSESELASVLPKPTAHRVWQYLHEEEKG